MNNLYWYLLGALLGCTIFRREKVRAAPIVRELRKVLIHCGYPDDFDIRVFREDDGFEVCVYKWSLFGSTAINGRRAFEILSVVVRKKTLRYCKTNPDGVRVEVECKNMLALLAFSKHALEEGLADRLSSLNNLCGMHLFSGPP